MDGPDLLVFRSAIEGLLAAARTERAMLPSVSPDRRFLLGVDAAALEALHPELAQTRSDSWLDLETPEFRDGYHRTRTAIAGALSRGEVPANISIPRRDRGGVS